ncbi:hypothetical protein Anapl_02612 [Anas platyrhynchos]|uniref:Uncharacterized protein n=1 Tax=Anas platyrhynchos TaxID=8839 RepID=R0KBD3_ANAPL|nr:hypothetical protein Anapl_02612 [Anas platyrhynchos]
MRCCTQMKKARPSQTFCSCALLANFGVHLPLVDYVQRREIAPPRTGKSPSRTDRCLPVTIKSSTLMQHQLAKSSREVNSVQPQVHPSGSAASSPAPWVWLSVPMDGTDVAERKDVDQDFSHSLEMFWSPCLGSMGLCPSLARSLPVPACPLITSTGCRLTCLMEKLPSLLLNTGLFLILLQE